MNLVDLLAYDSYIVLNRYLVAEIGFEPSIVLSVLCSYHKTYNEDDQFYRTQDKLMRDCCLTEYALRKSIKKLCDLGLLTVEKKGLPARNFYQVNENKLIEILESSEKKFNFHRTSGVEINTTGGVEINTTKTNNLKNYSNNKNNNKYFNKYSDFCDDEYKNWYNNLSDKEKEVEIQKFIKEIEDL